MTPKPRNIEKILETEFARLLSYIRSKRLLKNLAIKVMIPKGAKKVLEHQKNSETKLSYSL